MLILLNFYWDFRRTNILLTQFIWVYKPTWNTRLRLTWCYRKFPPSSTQARSSKSSYSYASYTGSSDPSHSTSSRVSYSSSPSILSYSGSSNSSNSTIPFSFNRSISRPYESTYTPIFPPARSVSSCKYDKKTHSDWHTLKKPYRARRTWFWSLACFYLECTWPCFGGRGGKQQRISYGNNFNISYLLTLVWKFINLFLTRVWVLEFDWLVVSEHALLDVFIYKDHNIILVLVRSWCFLLTALQTYCKGPLSNGQQFWELSCIWAIYQINYYSFIAILNI